MGEIHLLASILCHNFKLNSLGDHQYVSKYDFETNILGIEEGKSTNINDKICGMTLDIPSETKEVDTHTITISDILSQDNLDVTIIKNMKNVYSDIAKTVLDNINKQLEKSADDCTHIVELGHMFF